LDTSLKNDNVPETFSMVGEVEGHRVPCQYVKLAPLMCWGPSFNLSIWYVELNGYDDPTLVNPCIEFYKQVKESVIFEGLGCPSGYDAGLKNQASLVRFPSPLNFS